MHGGAPSGENSEHRSSRGTRSRIPQCALPSADLRTVAGEPEVRLSAFNYGIHGQIQDSDPREASPETGSTPFLPGVGRRTLLYIGSLGLCSWAFQTEYYAIVPACIFAFIAAHEVGQGTVIWVLISEIFPNLHRAAGQALSFTHSFFAASLTFVFPKMAEALAPSVIFGFFCFMVVLQQLIWVKTAVPETKGVSLEAMQEKLTNSSPQGSPV